MVEQILPDLYRTEIPLPQNPLRSINSYLIKGDGRFLIIDTGLNREECQKEMFSTLQKLNVDLNKTDFFITHLHADHSGLVLALATATSTIYFNQVESEYIISSILDPQQYWQQLYNFFLLNGFPEDELKKGVENHPGYKYGHATKNKIDFHIIREGDTIEIGDYSLKCIETPGHSPGHTCLYDAKKKLLFSGDHILFDITPNISLWSDEENPLKNYLASLDKVYVFDAYLTLPGHRNPSNDHRKRIKELKQHHQMRAQEILATLEKGEKTAFQVAPHVTWDIGHSSWELFPSQQKLFAVGETLSHLKYLEENNQIKRRIKDKTILFLLSN